MHRVKRWLWRTWAPYGDQVIADLGIRHPEYTFSNLTPFWDRSARDPWDFTAMGHAKISQLTDYVYVSGLYARLVLGNKINRLSEVPE